LGDVFAQGLGVDSRARAGDDADLDVFFGEFAGDADGCGFDDVWMSQCNLFDFECRDVLTSPADRVTGAPAEGQEAVAIERA
jgi:hypothetical protein